MAVKMSSRRRSLLDLEKCVFCICTYVCVHSCIWQCTVYAFCMHNKVDSGDTKRLVFLDNNIIFPYVPSSRALCVGCIFLHFSSAPYFPWCHATYLTGNDSEGRKGGWG